MWTIILPLNVTHRLLQRQSVCVLLTCFYIAVTSQELSNVLDYKRTHFDCVSKHSLQVIRCEQVSECWVMLQLRACEFQRCVNVPRRVPSNRRPPIERGNDDESSGPRESRVAKAAEKPSSTSRYNDWRLLFRPSRASEAIRRHTNNVVSLKIMRNRQRYRGIPQYELCAIITSPSCNSWQCDNDSRK